MKGLDLSSSIASNVRKGTDVLGIVLILDKKLGGKTYDLNWPPASLERFLRGSGVSRACIPGPGPGHPADYCWNYACSADGR